MQVVVDIDGKLTIAVVEWGRVDAAPVAVLVETWKELFVEM